LIFLGLFGLAWGGRLDAESETIVAVGDPLILSGQTPREQPLFAGGEASFTVAITNTGPVTLEAVSVTGATTSDCNRNSLGPIQPGMSKSYTCSRGDVSESFLNEIQANGMAGGKTVSHRSNSFVRVQRPELSITKNPQTQAVAAGGTASFNVVLFNSSDDQLQVDWVDDDSAPDCDRNPTTNIVLNPGGKLQYPCFLLNVQTPLTTVARFQATSLVDGSIYTVSDAAWVEVVKLEATLTPTPASIPEPGDLVTYTVGLVNVGSLPLTPTSLVTDRFGDILNPNNPQVEPDSNTCLPQPVMPTLPPFGGSFQCEFAAHVNGQPSSFNIVLTATAESVGVLTTTATANATVTITNVPASLTLTLGAEPPFINPPSRLVTFSIRIENTSGVDTLTVIGLTDELLGNLNGVGTCALPVEGIAPGSDYQCEFTATVSGQIGDQQSRTIFVSAVSDDPTPETLNTSKIVTVGVTDQPTQKLFMPSVTDDTVEPNNSCTRAYRLILNRQYYFRPPNKYDNTAPIDQRDQDYYTFELTQSQLVRIELTNFVPRAGQMIVRVHVEGGNPPCGSSLLAPGQSAIVGLNKTLDIGVQPAGRYYIQIINDGASNVRDLYGLIVRVE
jgi:hypothetical protein